MEKRFFMKFKPSLTSNLGVSSLRKSFLASSKAEVIMLFSIGESNFY